MAIRLFDTQAPAQASMRSGVRQLLRFELREQMKQLEKDLSGQSRYFGQTALQLHTLMSPDALREDMLSAIADRAFIGNDPLPRTEKEFAAQRQRARARLPAVAEALIRIVRSIADEYKTVLGRLCPDEWIREQLLEDPLASKSPADDAGKLKNELNKQLRSLIYPGFLSATPWERLQHLPRYLKGMILAWINILATPSAICAMQRLLRDYGNSMSGVWKSTERPGSTIRH